MVKETYFFTVFVLQVNHNGKLCFAFSVDNSITYGVNEDISDIAQLLAKKLRKIDLNFLRIMR